MADNLFDPDKLQSKIGKLPVWAWGIIGGTVVLGGYYLVSARKRARTSDAGVNPSNDNLASVFTGMATSDQTDLATLPVAGYNGKTISNGDNALGDSSLENNLTWLNKGAKVAVEKGGHTASGSVQALQKYLGGKPLSKYEVDVVNIALNANGYPPEGAPLMVKAIEDAKGTYTAPPANKDKTGLKPTTPTVTPKPTVTPTVTPTVSGGTSANGYPLDSQGREVIEVTKSFPIKIIGGKFAGYMKPIIWDNKKVVYVPVNKQPQIPAVATR